MNKPIRVLLLLAALPLAAARAAEPWPVRPVVVVATAAAGGTSDLFARLVAEGLTRELGRPVLRA